MIDYKRVAKECFWDLSIGEDDIKEILKGSDKREKRLLFEKILANSSKLFLDMSMFDKKELSTLLDEYKISSFNFEYISKRKNMIEVFFFNKPLLINELKWIA